MNAKASAINFLESASLKDTEEAKKDRPTCAIRITI